MSTAEPKFPLEFKTPQDAGAFTLALEGILVFPIRKGKKFPPEIQFVEGPTPGSRDPKQLTAWAKQYPGCNWAVRTGVVDADSRPLLVLDQDSGAADKLPGKIPPTRQVKTPNGFHFYFWLKPGEQIRNGTATPAKGFDIRGEHGYVVCPGSVADGKRYKVQNPTTPIADCPDWLRKALRPLIVVAPEKILPPGVKPVAAPVRHMPEKEVITLAPTFPSIDGEVETIIDEGQRNSSLTSVAGTMRRSGMDQEAITAALLIHNRAHCQPPLSDREVRGIAASVSRYEPVPEDTVFHLTDMGNARRLVYQHGEDLHYSYSLKKWFAFDGTRWLEDNPEGIERRAKETVLSIYREATSEKDDDRRKALGKWAAACESGMHLERMEKKARSEPGIPVKASELDADKWAFNTLPGTINLRTGELRPHDRMNLITKMSSVMYDAKATCPEFDKFLDLIMDGRPALVEFLWQIFGWSLTGDVSDEVFFIFHGQGANGKSQLIKTLQMVMGSYAVQATFDTFLQKNKGSIRNDIQRLRGARFVSAMESDEGDRLAMALVKQITGGDLVVERMLYKEAEPWQPQFKLVFGVNHLPQIRGQEFAT